MFGPLGCGTAMLGCGCSHSSSMFADNTWMQLVICNRHLQLPEVREAQVKDVWKVIMAHDVRTEEERERDE